MVSVDEHELKIIEELRTKNNINWMRIVSIALKHAPEQTREVLKQIRTLDIDISNHTQKLADNVNVDLEAQDRS